MTLHCVYCGERLYVEKPRGNPEAIAFLDKHEKQCGPKAVGAIMEFPDKKKKENDTA